MAATQPCQPLEKKTWNWKHSFGVLTNLLSGILGIKILEEGNIIDCFDIYTQPAFDNPLLKNHKIQLRPTSFPAQMKNSAPVTDPISETWSKREACPDDGTVPIHRTEQQRMI
ncbi:uncharacterized protein Pyn_25836 [Prunus yedoensis var. nudiflora]|uniref:Neprosin activation peptide domain-containing protein n=1 Tax=Prunus yedoensis var. nudiflora TaxID=2094558 RepID=A0A314Y8V2_PRUYE|nr:uncharacterized protein Pyn_25836 [Prunus yedoensis var. nudiflora]